ncbi:MAG: LuxR C-terminal-related transcriptional regulator [Bacteroidia bacterium]
MNKNSTLKKIRGSGYYLNKHPFIREIADNMPCLIYITNYQTSQYLYVNKRIEDILGYTAEEAMEKGQEWTIKELFHPEDLKIFSSVYFVRMHEFLKPLSLKELKKCRMTINYRMKRKDGVYTKVLQQSVILETDEFNNPLLTLGIMTDITPHKHDNAVNFAISYYDQKTGFKYLCSETITPGGIMLTAREKEIMKHLIHGHSATQIADILCLSHYTIKAHKRNIFEKTECNNIAQLVNYAISNGLR